MTWKDDHFNMQKNKGQRCNWDPKCQATVFGEETICYDCLDSYEASLEQDNYYDPLRPTPLPDDVPEVEAEDLESHSGRQWAFGIPNSYRGCDVCGEAEMTRTCEKCGHHARIIDCGCQSQPTEIAWCHDTRRDLCQACVDGRDPDRDSVEEEK